MELQLVEVGGEPGEAEPDRSRVGPVRVPGGMPYKSLINVGTDHIGVGKLIFLIRIFGRIEKSSGGYRFYKFK